MKSPLRRLTVFIIVLITLVSTSIASAAPSKLNDPLTGNQDVTNYLISPDGETAVYVADTTTDEVFDLFSVPIDGSTTPVKLNTGGNVTDFAISPDGTTVVYSADQTTDTVIDLFSVPLEGGPPTTLNGALGANGDVTNFSISPNSTTVVYLADATDEIFELFSVPLEGGTPTTLNGALGANGDVTNFSISPDSTTVVYLADAATDQAFELFSVPIDGGSVQSLNTPLAAGQTIFNFAISSDSTQVVYDGDATTDEVFELYSVPIDGSNTPTTLNGALGANGDVNDFDISRDSSTVVYRADQSSDEVFELFSVPIDGGMPTKLNITPIAGGNVLNNFKLSPDSSTVVYGADQDTDNVFEIYSVPMDGSSAPIKLNDTFPAGADLISEYIISPDSSRVIYFTDEEENGVNQLYSVPLDRSSDPVKLNGPLASNGVVISAAITPNSSTVIYRATEDNGNIAEIYSVPLDGSSASFKLNGTLAVDGNVTTYTIGPLSNNVFYLADQTTNDIFELFVAALDAPTTPANLTATYDNEAIDLTWDDTATNEATYAVDRSIDGGTNWDTIATNLPANTTTYTDSDIDCATIVYNYRVRAFNDIGESDPSNVAEVTRSGCEPDTPPSNVTAVYNVELHQVSLGWSDTTANEDGFRIERQKEGATEWQVLTTTTTNATSYIDDTATCDQTYIYRITATNLSGDSPSASSDAIATPCNIFTDIPGPNQPPFFTQWIEDFYQAGITTGCNSGTPGVDLRYCPKTAVSRGQMAVLILRAMSYPDDVTPTGADPNPFTDVPSPNQPPVFENWIEDFYVLGITTGCNNGAEGVDLRYCPETDVTRGQMAVFILRALEGEDYVPVNDPTDPFIDIPGPNLPPSFEAWIEDFYNRGITTGCNNGDEGVDLRFCPDTVVDRGQMAVFILRAFDDIPDPNDP